METVYEHRDPSLNERVERLEKTVEELRAELRHVLLNTDRVLLDKGNHVPESEPRWVRSTSVASTYLPRTATNNGFGSGKWAATV